MDPTENKIIETNQIHKSVFLTKQKTKMLTCFVFGLEAYIVVSLTQNQILQFQSKDTKYFDKLVKFICYSDNGINLKRKKI